MTRSRLYALVSVLTALAVLGLYTLPNAHRINTGVLALAGHLPASVRCESEWATLAALAQGFEPSAECVRALGPGWRGPLTRLALDGSRSEPTRRLAHEALAGGGVSEALVLGPRSSPNLRRAALTTLLARPSMDDTWVERAGWAALHGLGDRAAARRFAGGEPDAALEAAHALAANPDDADIVADVYLGLATTPGELDEAIARIGRGLSPLGLPSEWDVPLRRSKSRLELLLTLMRLGLGEPEAPSPPVPGADAVIDLVYAGDGEAGDHLRDELGRVARWIGRVPEERRPARLIAAIAHPEATYSAVVVMGDMHAVLVKGRGSPGSNALVAHDLALAARVPVQVWLGPAGRLALRVAGRWTELGCGSGEAPGEQWQQLTPAQIEALALVEGIGLVLRDGRAEDAPELVAAARDRWSGAPGLEEATAAIAGMTPPPPPPPRPKRRAPVILPTPITRDGRVGFDAAGALLQSFATLDQRVHEARLVAEMPDLPAAARARVAWWAASAGNTAIARQLLDGVPPLDGIDEGVRRDVLRVLGEPAARPSRASACPTAFATYPDVQ